MWWCQITDWLKFETRPSSPVNFGMAYKQSVYEINLFEKFNISLSQNNC